MSTQAEKQKENKRQFVANAVSQKQSIGEPALQFLDNRPEVITQTKLQNTINNNNFKKHVAQLVKYEDYLRYDRKFADTEVKSSVSDLPILKGDRKKLHHGHDLDIGTIKKIFNSTSPWKSIYWYHGTNEADARSIARDGFNPELTIHSKAYGEGTYFAATEYAARQYNEIVMKVDLSNCNLYWVAEVKDHVYGGASPFDSAIKFNNAGNRIKEASNYAKKIGMDGCFITGSEEWIIATVFNPSKVKIVDVTRIIEKRKPTRSEKMLRGDFDPDPIAVSENV